MEASAPFIDSGWSYAILFCDGLDSEAYYSPLEVDYSSRFGMANFDPTFVDFYHGHTSLSVSIP